MPTNFLLDNAGATLEGASGSLAGRRKAAVGCASPLSEAAAMPFKRLRREESLAIVFSFANGCCDLFTVRITPPVSGQRDHFVVANHRHLEVYRPLDLTESKVLSGAQGTDCGNCSARRDFELHALCADCVKPPHEAARHVGIRVVQDVERVARIGLPGEELDHALARDARRLAATGEKPADGVLQQ